jgi:hypothetical protein
VLLKKHSLALVRKQTIPTERPTLVVKLVLTFVDRGCHVVSAVDSHGHIFGFLGQSRYYFFQVGPQLYSRGWVEPIPDPLHLRKSGSTRIEKEKTCQFKRLSCFVRWWYHQNCHCLYVCAITWPLPITQIWPLLLLLYLLQFCPRPLFLHEYTVSKTSLMVHHIQIVT